MQTEDGIEVNILTPAQKADLALIQQAIMHLRYDAVPLETQIEVLKQTREICDCLALELEQRSFVPPPEKVAGHFHRGTGV